MEIEKQLSQLNAGLKKMENKEAKIYFLTQDTEGRAIASVNANPKIAYPNKVLVSDGLRATELINEPNTIPIPAPAPARAIVAQPAPINFAPSAIKQQNAFIERH